LDGVPLWDVDLKMHMVFGEAEFAELKAKAFQVLERLDADVSIDLFSKAVVSVMGDEHHGHPVIAGVTRNLFRAIAIYIYQNFSRILSHLCRAHPYMVCRVRQKRDWLIA